MYPFIPRLGCQVSTLANVVVLRSRYWYLDCGSRNLNKATVASSVLRVVLRSPCSMLHVELQAWDDSTEEHRNPGQHAKVVMQVLNTIPCKDIPTRSRSLLYGSVGGTLNPKLKA